MIPAAVTERVETVLDKLFSGFLKLKGSSTSRVEEQEQEYSREIGPLISRIYSPSQQSINEVNQTSQQNPTFFLLEINPIYCNNIKI